VCVCVHRVRVCFVYVGVRCCRLCVCLINACACMFSVLLSLRCVMHTQTYVFIFTHIHTFIYLPAHLPAQTYTGIVERGLHKLLVWHGLLHPTFPPSSSSSVFLSFSFSLSLCLSFPRFYALTLSHYPLIYTHLLSLVPFTHTHYYLPVTHTHNLSRILMPLHTYSLLSSTHTLSHSVSPSLPLGCPH